MVIVDTNSWGAVFDCCSPKHPEFASVRLYILATKASMAWGGSRYIEELRKAAKYLGIHSELTKGGRAIRFRDEDVDAASGEAKSKCQHRDFDDAHLIGLQVVSRAAIIVSHDKRAYPFLKRKNLYPKNHERPKIYCKKQHSKLLNR